MKKTILKFGLYSAITIVVLFSINLFTPLAELDMGIQEVLGYLAMFIALIFVFFGIKSYRDQQLNGSISFGKGFKLGFLITLIPATIFGIFDVIYILMNPEFFQNYRDAAVADLEKQFSGAELTAKIKEIDDMMAFAGNPAFDFFLMFSTVLILGIIVSLISSFILRKDTPKQEAA